MFLKKSLLLNDSMEKETIAEKQKRFHLMEINIQLAKDSMMDKDEIEEILSRTLQHKIRTGK